MQVTDNELRAVVLEALYKFRHDQLISFDKELKLPDVREGALRAILTQLEEKGLIDWRFKPYSGLGNGRIAAYGVDVVEQKVAPPFPISFHQSITVQGSSNVQIGAGNVQNFGTIEKLNMAVDESKASQEEKAEAKSLIDKLCKNKLIIAILKRFGLNLD